MGPRAEPPGRQYREAGVDIDAGARAVDLIKPLARSTHRPGVLSDLGAFGGLFQVQGYRDPILVSSTDSVGTKVRLAIQLRRLDTIGVDLVNHCVNDIFVSGADPLFFLDYVGLGRLVPEEIAEIVGGIAKACREAGCALIGGETAELPGLYRQGDFDLVGFIVGAVERDAILDGSRVEAGDVLLGLPSSGLHTSGYSLARKALATDDDPSVLERHFSELGGALADALLAPHRCYYRMLKPVIGEVSAMAHITGGGLVDNVPRALPEGLAARIDQSAWEVPAIFRLIQEASAISDAEMARVFNLGIGMVVIAGPDRAGRILRELPGAINIGDVVPQKGTERVIFHRGSGY